jgi:uncharacterized protein
VRSSLHAASDGRDPAALRRYNGELFGWTVRAGDASSDDVSEPGQYGFVDGATTGVSTAGVGGRAGHEANVPFYVSVRDVAAALEAAEPLGGTRRWA